MNLQVGPSIDSNKVRLDFRKSPDKPDNAPSYQIDKSKADEFVKKYNRQENKLFKYTSLGMALFIMADLVLSIMKRSLKTALIGVPAIVGAGLGISALISRHYKSKLMDKYEVIELQKR